MLRLPLSFLKVLVIAAALDMLKGFVPYGSLTQPFHVCGESELTQPTPNRTWPFIINTSEKPQYMAFVDLLIRIFFSFLTLQENKSILPRDTEKNLIRGRKAKRVSSSSNKYESFHFFSTLFLFFAFPESL